MVTNRVIWITVFIIFSHPCEVNEVLDDVKFGVGVDVDMLSDIEIVVMATPAITLDLLVGITYAVDVLTDLLTKLLSVLIIGVVTVIDVDMLADEIFNAVMTPSEFTLSSSP